MRKFTDLADREWKLELNLFLWKRVRAETGVALTDIFGDENSLGRMLMDFEKTVDVLWLFCEEQAEERGLEMMDFLKGLSGDVIGEATSALLRAVVDFFPHQEQRDAAMAMIEKAEEAGRLMLSQTVEAIQAVDLLPMTNSSDTTSDSPPSLASAATKTPGAN